MIEQLYLDLTEETNDTKICGKLFQSCKSAVEELFREERGNELHRNLGERGKTLVTYFTVLHRQNYT